MNQPFTFQDIFSKRFLEAFSLQRVDMTDLGITLAVCLALGLCIYLLYRYSFSGAVYDNTYAVSLVLTCIITGLIIKAISSNVVLSLGMVGALSIVRFRTAIKNPIDIIFIFWAIGVGIISGAGLHLHALIGSALIAVVLLLMTRKAGQLRVFLLVIHGLPALDDAAVRSILKSDVLRFNIKSKILDTERVEISYEVKLRKDRQDLLQRIKDVPHVESVSLINYSPIAGP
jgi:hypothetical protein